MKEEVLKGLKLILFQELCELMPREQARKKMKEKDYFIDLDLYEKELKEQALKEALKEVKLSRELDRKLWMEVAVENAKINNHPEVVANNVLRHFKDKF